LLLTDDKLGSVNFWLKYIVPSLDFEGFSLQSLCALEMLIKAKTQGPRTHLDYDKTENISTTSTLVSLSVILGVIGGDV
jgi:hypothetical protein